MTWTKLSDDFTDDCWTLTDQAFRLHVEGLTWSNRKLLDLRLPKSEVQRFAKHPDAATELVASGWWTDDGDHYVIRHHATYQRTREAVVKQQEVNRANGRKGGRPSREQVVNLTTSETESLSESLSGSETERDRTGQDRALEVEKSEQATLDDDNGWPEAARPGSGSTCPDCGGPMRAGSVRCQSCLSASVRDGAA